MHEPLTDLVATLRQEIAGYRNLLLLIRGERARIVKGDLRAIRDVVRRKEALTEDLQRLATCRAALLDRLAVDLGEERAGFTMARLAACAPGQAGEVLQGLLVEFRRLVGQLMAANEVNRTLLASSLESVQGALMLFRTIVSKNLTYGAEGRLGEPAESLLALNRTA
jgi:flagellar biosynthesis/type III secretory pathway chaperone